MSAWILLLSTFVCAQGLDLNPHLSYVPSEDSMKNGGANNFVQTRERIIKIGGVDYRQIEYKGDVFVIKANQPDTATDCSQMPLPPNQYAVQAETTITKRTKFFIESLRQHCDPVSHTVVTQPKIDDTNLGVKFEGEKPGDSDKKIFVNPRKRDVGAGITF